MTQNTVSMANVNYIWYSGLRTILDDGYYSFDDVCDLDFPQGVLTD